MKDKKIVVLGAGLVGNAIAIDLNERFDVTAVDIDEESLRPANADRSPFHTDTEYRNNKRRKKVGYG